MFEMYSQRDGCKQQIMGSGLVKTGRLVAFHFGSSGYEDQGRKSVVHFIIIIKSDVSTYLCVVIIFRGCVFDVVLP